MMYALCPLFVALTIGIQDFSLERILDFFGTWALAIATIALVFVGIYYSRSDSRTRRELIKQQSELLGEQKNIAELQKLALESTDRSAKLQEKSVIVAQMIKIDQLINDESALSDRNTVDNHVSGNELHANFHIVAARVSSRFDRIGAIVAIHEDLRNAYLHVHARETGKSWIALKDYVSAERKRRNDQLYYRFFATIGQESVEYWNSTNPNDPLGIVE